MLSSSCHGLATYTHPRNHGNDSDLSEMMGIAQALISILAEDDDRLRSIQRGRTRITFTLKAPLYLFAVSDWGEPEHVVGRAWTTVMRR